jgi:16S rRNA G966 N2-methylase RsmD
LNRNILLPEVQAFLKSHLNADAQRVALSKSPFSDVSAQELAAQITAKKRSEKKLPTWFGKENIYYPRLISIEQCSSEPTAAYKSTLIKGEQLADLTGGFGVDTYFFAQQAKSVVHCEINPDLSEIAAHNAHVLGANNITFLANDGIEYIRNSTTKLDTIYIDPARRSQTGKVFLLKDCTPNVVAELDMLLQKAERIIIKTSPLLDITAGVKELRNVSEVQVISTRNECKELLFIIDRGFSGPLKITSVAINATVKKTSFTEADDSPAELLQDSLGNYLYEPDVALLKSGKFNSIASHFSLRKLDQQSQLYTSDSFNCEFPGRIFRIVELLSITNLKKQKDLSGNVIVRNYPEKPEKLVQKFKIKPAAEQFLIFTKLHNEGYGVLKAQILQYY